MINEKEVTLTGDEIRYFGLNEQYVGMSKLYIAILQYVREKGITSEIAFINWLSEVDFLDMAKKPLKGGDLK